MPIPAGPCMIAESNGVLSVGDRLASWGKDGALRFWSLDGTALPGGAVDVNPGGIGGVLRVGDRLVSWGGYPAIWFWSLEGAALPGQKRPPL